MLLNIETNGATNIVINVPAERIKYAQDLINIFEKNAVFVNSGYSNTTIVTPKQTLELGENIKFKSSGYNSEEIELEVVGKGDSRLEDAVIATPEVFISMSEATKKYKIELEKLTKEITFLKMQVANKDEEIEALKSDD